jgi:hypothetical protein
VPCPGCAEGVLFLADVDTDEVLVVDDNPLDVATVEVFQAGPALACRRRGIPGRAPVHREHSCGWADAVRAGELAADVAQAHAPADPGIEQAGWRAP